MNTTGINVFCLQQLAIGSACFPTDALIQRLNMPLKETTSVTASPRKGNSVNKDLTTANT